MRSRDNKTDEDAWLSCHPEDRWLFDKLLLSSHLGYLCGPCGVGVPRDGEYIVRPILYGYPVPILKRLPLDRPPSHSQPMNNSSPRLSGLRAQRSGAERKYPTAVVFILCAEIVSYSRKCSR